MAEYTVVKVSDVPDQSQNLGHDPEQFEIRFLRNDLGCEDCGVSFARYSKGFASEAHTHNRQEEIYVLVSGRAQALVGDNERDRPRAVDGASRPAEDATRAAGGRRRGRDLRQGRRSEHRAGRCARRAGRLRLALLGRGGEAGTVEDRQRLQAGLARRRVERLLERRARRRTRRCGRTAARRRASSAGSGSGRSRGSPPPSPPAGTPGRGRRRRRARSTRSSASRRGRSLPRAGLPARPPRRASPTTPGRS